MRGPGKKFKIFEFAVEGMAIPVEIRITDDNRFYAEVDGDKFEKATFDELKGVVLPRLQQVHKLVYDPVIDVEYDDPEKRNHHSYYGSRQDWQRQEVKLSFTAGWVSRAPISTAEDRHVFHRWIETKVDEQTAEIGPLNRDRTSYASRMGVVATESFGELIPFTPDRWRRLMAIVAALTDVRDKIAAVMRDASGAKLDALPSERLLEAMPAAPVKKHR